MKKVFLVTALIISTLSAQKLTKEFYNEDWKICDSITASYYRLIEYNSEGQSIGDVKDYYITGEVQWVGRFSFIDKFNSQNNKEQGICTWYYKNGNKSSQSNYLDGVKSGKSVTYFENGNRESELFYINGVKNGLAISWYESGLLRSYATYKDGKQTAEMPIDCDEFGECYTVVKYDFVEDKKQLDDFGFNFNSFNIGKGDPDLLVKSKKPIKSLKTTYKKKGLILQADKESVVKTFPVSVDMSHNVFIEVDYSFPKTTETSKSGFVYCYESDKNYYYVTIDKNGNYQVGQNKDGEKIELSKGTATANFNDYSYDYFDFGNSKKKKSPVSKEKKYNLKFYHYEDTIQLFLGYTPIFKSPTAKSNGSYVGVLVDANSSMKVNSIMYSQEIDEPFVSADIDTKTLKNKAWKSSGSGFVVSTTGYIVTNHHVVDEAKEVEVDLLRNGEVKSYACEVILMDEKSDLAVIKIKDSTFVPYKSIPYTLQSKLTDVGTNVFALGYPLAMGTLGNELKYTEGSINARTGMNGEVLAYQISVPVQPGNSGGPLFDYKGNIIGVVNSKLFNADNVAFAVKANYILNLLYMLPDFPNYPSQTTVKTDLATEQVKLYSEYIPLIKCR